MLRVAQSCSGLLPVPGLMVCTKLGASIGDGLYGLVGLKNIRELSQISPAEGGVHNRFWGSFYAVA